ncbi:MAG: hypothetical protein IKQ60_07540 [Candidatus Methanomethylophilaceae archaeon]|nr:hypothetical protein [Candidatus Methanomethylophilaceae archaeon]
MPAESKYVDSCCVILMIDKDDTHRDDYGCGRKKYEALFPKNTRFSVPEVAMGETVMKIMDKRPGSFQMAMQEYERLVGLGFLNVSYIRDPSFTFSLSKEISKERADSRDRISAADALILACAAADKDCSVFYTSDSKLLTDSFVSKAVDEWRSSSDYDEMRIMDIADALKL